MSNLNIIARDDITDEFGQKSRVNREWINFLGTEDAEAYYRQRKRRRMDIPPRADLVDIMCSYQMSRENPVPLTLQEISKGAIRDSIKLGLFYPALLLLLPEHLKDFLLA